MRISPCSCFWLRDVYGGLESFRMCHLWECSKDSVTVLSVVAKEYVENSARNKTKLFKLSFFDDLSVYMSEFYHMLDVSEG